MAKINALINERLKKSENSPKMAAMAKQSANGSLTGFSGIFNITELSNYEKEILENILYQYADSQENISQDLTALISITSEVKAINNQAAILHGERIKKAHTILTKYKDGAFTSWLMAAYGNRQTPYNLMLYYEFFEAIPKNLRSLLESMPRQAIYTLASRKGPFDEKVKLIESYNGQTKTQLLTEIRARFPLDEQDRRNQDVGETIIKILKSAQISLRNFKWNLSSDQRSEIAELIIQLRRMIKE